MGRGGIKGKRGKATEQRGHKLKTDQGFMLANPDSRLLTCIIVTVGSILGGRGRWISYLFRSPTLWTNDRMAHANSQ